MLKFMNPKTPVYNKGVLVIHSDDGTAGDFTHWFPLLKKKSREHSYWHNIGTAVMCPAVNTATIGTSGMMTVANLQEMVKNRSEILSHGRHHVGIGANPLIAAVVAGATRIDINGAGEFANGIAYTYRIFEGTKEEQFQITATSGDSYGSGFLTVSSPLVNSYTTAAKVQLTDASAEALLKGCIDDAKAWGIDMKHHVNTYHAGGDHFPSAKSEEWIGKYFISGRGSAGTATNYPNTWNVRKLKSALNVERTNAAMDTLLDEVALNDGMLIYYGHGEKDATNLAKLEYLIDAALNRGIRIKTMTGALKHFGFM